MSGRVERSSATFKLTCTIAVLLICLATRAVAEDEELSELFGKLRLSADQVADYLSNVTPAEGEERRLVRWEQDEVTLGIVASTGVTAQMIDQAVSQIRNTFEYAGRRLDACIEHWERPAGLAGASPKISACESRSIEIDLLIDVSEVSILGKINRPQLPSNLTSDNLNVIWQRIRGTVLAKPNASLCSGAVVADATVRNLMAGAAIVRPAPEQNTLLTVFHCARDLGYILLGSVPIPDADGTGGYWDGELSKLLYSPNSVPVRVAATFLPNCAPPRATDAFARLDQPQREGFDRHLLAVRREGGDIRRVEIILRAAHEAEIEIELARLRLERGVVQADDRGADGAGAADGGFRQAAANSHAARGGIDGQRAHAGPALRQADTLGAGIGKEDDGAHQRVASADHQQLAIVMQSWIGGEGAQTFRIGAIDRSRHGIAIFAVCPQQQVGDVVELGRFGVAHHVPRHRRARTQRSSHDPASFPSIGRGTGWCAAFRKDGKADPA